VWVVLTVVVFSEVVLIAVAVVEILSEAFTGAWLATIALMVKNAFS